MRKAKLSFTSAWPNHVKKSTVCLVPFFNNFIHPSVVKLYNYYVQLQGIFTSSIELFKKDPQTWFLLIKRLTINGAFYKLLWTCALYEERSEAITEVESESGERVRHTVGKTLGRLCARKYNKKPLVAHRLNQNKCYFFCWKPNYLL